MNSLNIYVDYFNFSNNLNFSQALKVSSFNHLNIDYFIDGEINDLAIFNGYSSNLLIKEKEDKPEYLAKVYEKEYSKLLNDIKLSNDDTFFFLRSFNKKFCIYLINSNSLETFNILNSKIKQEFKILNKDHDFFNKFDVSSDPLFKGETKIDDILIDDSKFILMQKDTFFDYVSSINSFSNYFKKRQEFQNKNNNSFMSNISNMFRFKSNNESNEREKTLYTDIVLEFNILIKKEDIVTYELYLPNNLNVNDMIKGLNILSDLIDNKFNYLNMK